MKPGDKFGKWTVIKGPVFERDKRNRRRKYLACQCECGKLQLVLEHNLKSGEHSKCHTCSRIPLQADINWKRVTQLYKRGVNWTQIAKIVGVDAVTLRKWRRIKRPAKYKVGPRSWWVTHSDAFEQFNAAIAHYSGSLRVLLREYYTEYARREVEILKKRLATTDQHVHALKARGLEYIAIDQVLGLAEGSAYASARRHEPWSPPFDFEAVERLEKEGKKWSEINRALGNSYMSGIILKEVFYFLIEHRIEMNELAGV